MRAIWKATVSFGLVNVPVKFYSATSEHDIKAHQVHARDGGKIRYKKVCEACSETVEARDIAKAYDSDEGVKILTDDDLSTLHESDNRAIEVLEFVAAGEIDPLMFDRPYYLDVAQPEAAKAYALLTRTLAQDNRLGIVRFSMRGKTHLAALRVVGKGNVLAVQTLRWADEIREPDFPSLRSPVDVSEAELKVAATVVESMHNEWNPDRYRDVYKDELQELIASKAPADASGVENGESEVSDLLAKLEASAKAKRPRVRKIAEKPVRKRAKVAS